MRMDALHLALSPPLTAGTLDIHHAGMLDRVLDRSPIDLQPQQDVVDQRDGQRDEHAENDRRAEDVGVHAVLLGEDEGDNALGQRRHYLRDAPFGLV